MSARLSDVLCVVGTRPEAIKLAPVIHALRADSRFGVRICLTAQHRDLVDPVLSHFRLAADVDLNLMRDDQRLPELTAALFSGLDPVLRPAPDWVLVQGDTTSAMVAAVTGFYAGARVAHVEAGLRTGRLDDPFPEEFNRRVISSVAFLHFAPTPGARAHLVAEGIDDTRITMTGNTVVDALRWTQAQAPATPPGLVAPPPCRTVLVTLHRRESFGAPLEAMCGAIAQLAAATAPDVRFVCTVHPNPHVGPTIERLLRGIPGIVLTPPLSYPDTVALISQCAFVMTDSGGLQEEAPALGKPVLVLRDATERPEGVEAGVARLVGREPAAIIAAATELLRNEEACARMARAIHPYGDGRAAERIVQALAAESGGRP